MTPRPHADPDKAAPAADDVDELLAAGWTGGSRLDLWIDPDTGHEVPTWRALPLARRAGRQAA